MEPSPSPPCPQPFFPTTGFRSATLCTADGSAFGISFATRLLRRQEICFFRLVQDRLFSNDCLQTDHKYPLHTLSIWGFPCESRHRTVTAAGGGKHRQTEG